MPLRQHLEELRTCIFRSLIAFVVLFAVGMVFTDWLIRFMVTPYEIARQAIIESGEPDPGVLIMIRPAEGFLFSMKVAMAFALLVGAPFYLLQVWSFVGAGLHSHEKAAVGKSFPIAVGLFIAGLVFGYRVLVPMAYPILLTWVDSEMARPSITVSEYFGSLVSLTLLMGFVFELPVLMWLGVRSGMVELKTLSSSRRTAIVVMLLFAAVMTPPDVVTQIFVVVPMFGLYEVGLLFARKADAARQRALG